MRRRLKASLAFPFLMLACAPLPPQESKSDFSSGEHLILGDTGFQSACKACGPLTRADGKQTFSYGELVAFSGDFYATPEAIYFEQEKPFFQWNRNDIGDVKDRFRDEVETIENFLHGHSSEAYPDFSLAYAWNYPDYLGITLANSSHFGFYNMIAYVNYHSLAISMALSAHDLSTSASGDAERLRTQALFMNAFADHFLTDSFAAGHIRNPRVQILNWSRNQNLSERAAATLAKVIHDRDGEVRASGEHGLNVTNARGDVWLTRCDSQLFWNNSLQDPSIDLPVQAVAASVREVMNAYEKGETPPGVFAATQLVPFPAPFERRLTDLFFKDLPESEYDRILAQMSFYLRLKIFSGVDKSVLKKLTADLPGIMQAFGADVQSEIQQNPLLSQYLPAAYLDAYSHIQ